MCLPFIMSASQYASHNLISQAIFQLGIQEEINLHELKEY